MWKRITTRVLIAKVIIFSWGGVCDASTFHFSGYIYAPPNKSVALFRNGSETLVAKMGDKLFNGLRLHDIGHRFVLIQKGKEIHKFMLYQEIFPTEKFSLQNETGWKREGDTVYFTETLSKHLIESSVIDLMMEVRADAASNELGVYGFKLDLMDKGSFYDLIGLKNGDIVTHINDHALTGVITAISVLRSMKSEKNIDISLLRYGQKRNLRLVIQ